MRENARRVAIVLVLAGLYATCLHLATRPARDEARQAQRQMYGCLGQGPYDETYDEWIYQPLSSDALRGLIYSAMSAPFSKLKSWIREAVLGRDEASEVDKALRWLSRHGEPAFGPPDDSLWAQLTGPGSWWARLTGKDDASRLAVLSFLGAPTVEPEPQE